MAHPPLASGSHETRILYLHSGQWQDDLVGDVRVIALSEHNRYTALSYAWRDDVSLNSWSDLSEIKESIVCNGDILPISPTLGRALQYLRYEHDLRPLWIDKICINQNDVREREQQVQAMGKIYGDSESVAVWLGEADDNVALVWDILHRARLYLPYQPAQTHDLAFRAPTAYQASTPPWMSESQLRIAAVPPELARIPSATHPCWNNVKALLNRAWMSRIWTLQEVAVSRHCYVMCGRHAMNWEDFYSAALGLIVGGYSDHLLGHGPQSILLRDSERRMIASGHRSSPRSLLGSARGFGAQEGHDKIFALLSLVSEVTAARIQLMYTRDLAGLYADVARACIIEDKHLAILGEIELRPEGVEMPSWAPDWREKSPTRIMLNAFSAENDLYRSAGNTEPVMFGSDSTDCLVLRGRLIAPVERIVHIHARLNLNDKIISHADRKLEALRWSPAVWSGIYRSAVTRYWMPVTVARQCEVGDALSRPSGPRGDHGTLDPTGMLAHALRRTVTADLYPRPNGRLPKTMSANQFPAYAAWEAREFEGHPPADVLHEHDLRARETMINRRAFIAGEEDDAYLGIGLYTMRPGDWICVLDGGHTPFILRPPYTDVERTASECRNWTLISECYVHGLMDGEAMDPARELEQKDFVLGKSNMEDAMKARL